MTGDSNLSYNSVKFISGINAARNVRPAKQKK